MRLSPQQKKERGMALSLTEFQQVSGLGYIKAKRMSTMTGFPIFDGVIFWVDFERWRRKMANQLLAGAACQHSPTVEDDPLHEHKFHEPSQKRDSLTSLPPRAARLLQKAESPL